VDDIHLGGLKKEVSLKKMQITANKDEFTDDEFDGKYAYIYVLYLYT
jgi:hypothetical protein